MPRKSYLDDTPEGRERLQRSLARQAKRDRIPPEFHPRVLSEAEIQALGPLEPPKKDKDFRSIDWISHFPKKGEKWGPRG